MEITRNVAESVVAAYLVKYQWPQEFAPQLLEDFDGRKWTIVWEEGPDEWVYVPLDDDHLTGMGFTIKGVAAPEGVLIEAVNHYSKALYPA